MQLAVRSQEKNKLDLEFTGERKTFLYMLKERLLEDPKVDTATVMTDHPVLSDPRLIVITSSGKPETAIKRAAKEVRNALDELEDAFLDALD